MTDSAAALNMITQNQQKNQSETSAINNSNSSNQMPVTLATTAAPYIIQNGNIYQLTSNNQLISRNSIQLTNGDSNANLIR